MERIESIAGEASAGMRLDRFLASIRPDTSRSAIQREIRDGNVVVSGTAVRQPAHRLRGGEVIVWSLREARPLAPETVPLSILYEDDALIAIDKPAGLVVHPGAGTTQTTLVEGLLAARDLPESDDPARPGIVHRLDKETSGVIVVAKTPAALHSLRRQFADRTVAKAYLAVAEGTIEEDEGTIDAPVGRDPSRPRRMAVEPRGRLAQTEFRVLGRAGGRTLLLVSPRTGRTHQIRAHLRFIGHPIVGDPVYGRAVAARPPASQSDSSSRGPGQAAHVAQRRSACAEERTRMFLHAWRLVLRHPETGAELRLVAPPPSEFPDYPYERLPWDRIPPGADES
jgi:23S rRNA pseudouridine1911/1915/1917 synthase